MTSEFLINGEPASVEALGEAAFQNYAAFTSMQVQGGGVRGLDLHIRRLRDSALELFGVAPSEAKLRDQMRLAVGGREERLSLRVQLFLPTITPRRVFPKGEPSVLVRVSAGQPPIRGPLRLQTRTYEREAPHLKHAATFGLIREARAAHEAGFDDVLFVGRDGMVSEGSIWNIGFVEDQRVVWPRAPMLAGVGQALIERGLDEVGLSSEVRPIARDELATFDRAFICNSATFACPVSGIDNHPMVDDPAMMARLEAARFTNAREPI